MVETIEGDWDRMYREFPEVYHRFATRQYEDGTVVRTINRLFKLHDKIVLDIGSGTGLSTINLATYARYVFGVEPEGAMQKVAAKKTGEIDVKNVSYLRGTAEHIPLRSDSVDLAISITSIPVYRADPVDMERMAEMAVEEAERVVRRGCFVIVVGIARFWYGGELASVILGKSKETKEDSAGKRESLLRTLGFQSHKDVEVTARFRSIQEAVETYGFIHGRKAIDYILSHRKTSVKWKFRIYYKQTSKQCFESQRDIAFVGSNSTRTDPFQ